MLQPFERQRGDRLALVHRLAGVAVLVDQAVDRPGQVVFQRVGREGRQRAHAHLHVAHRIEAAGQVMGHDADEARRQAALRHEGRLGTLGQLLDRLGGGHVLGQVEVVAAAFQRQLGGGDGQVIGQRVDDRVLAAQLGGQGDAVLGVDLGGGDALGRPARPGKPGSCRARSPGTRRWRAAGGRWSGRCGRRRAGRSFMRILQVRVCVGADSRQT